MPAAIASAEARGFRVTQDAIAEMERWMERIGERWGVDDRVLFRSRVCVSELACNVMQHGQVAADTDEIFLKLRHIPPGLEIEISDPGVAFDPVVAPAIEPGMEDVGGYGLRLIRAYAQSLSYRRDQNRNVVILRLAPLPGDSSVDCATSIVSNQANRNGRD